MVREDPAMRRTFGIVRTGRLFTVTGDSRGTPALALRSASLKAALVAAGVGMLAAGAWVSVPFYPVPMTMQTLAVLVVGGILGPRLGVAAVASYLGLGLAGAPIFHSGLGGAAVLAGPTGGYLAGFVPAAFLIGLASRRAVACKGISRRIALLAGGALLAEAAIYALGLPWLVLVTGLSMADAVAGGLAPFVFGDLAKTAAAVIVVHGGRSLLSHRGLIPF
jgi:biotin transport system substrate-specific component